METKLHVFVCQTFAHHSYPEFDQKLRELRAVPLMHSISAARTVLTAKELKDALRKTLDDSDRILVVEVCAGWASRRAENNLGVYFHPEGVRLSRYGSSAGENERTETPRCWVCNNLLGNRHTLRRPETIALSASNLATRQVHLSSAP